MYRGPSPIFDVPEFPTLRRVKPLPKRRHTSAALIPDAGAVETSTTFSLPLDLDNLQPEAMAAELLEHADMLSARLALQSYYMPILARVPEFLPGGDADNTTTTGATLIKKISPGYDDDVKGGDVGDQETGTGPIELATGYGSCGARDEEDEQVGGDYVDHLQQPGNTKKRKVPANMSSSPRGVGVGSGHATQDEPMERGIPTGRPEHEIIEQHPQPSPFGLLGQKRGKLTAATLAGLQHKEMLKSRKRQLAAVLGALSHGDTLALDQALSANYPFTGAGFDDLRNTEPPKARLSKRRVVRLARALRINRTLRHPDEVPFPSCKFTFTCPSATADRLIATKEEVAMLRNRFEAELARQAAKAAKLAAASKATPRPVKGNRQKRVQQRARTAGNPNEQTRGKKKRAALANASNPHHLRNYVPSRLPHSGQTNATQTNNPQNYLGPMPLRFPEPQLTNPAEEWICAFCEYDLFYGDEQEYRRAIRNRKKILQRRRRARERAAAAASGNSTARGPDRSGSVNEEYDAGFEPSADEFSTVPKLTKWKGDPNKERERAGSSVGR
ncbi:hypothetical protein BD779DRAFT_1549831 [Infundibulicybe gibba]|nr:hypothetical protein BD779DRAFT_1549831 [Infundibulicybe gibba]